jgi:hypothetical protein
MLLNRMGGSSRPERALPVDLRLQAIADNIPTSLIDELWVFPPLPDRDFACEFIVLVCYDGGEDRRRIVTAHVDAERADPEKDEFQWVQRLREHGTAPHQWVAGMPERLLQRLSEAGIPDVVEVGGRTQAWEEAVSRFANGNGNGNGIGNGNGFGVLGGALAVDSRVLPTITFSTIDETAVSGSPNQEPD